MPEFEITYDATTRRAECSCGRWRAWGIAAHELDKAGRAHRELHHRQEEQAARRARAHRAAVNISCQLDAMAEEERELVDEVIRSAERITREAAR